MFRSLFSSTPPASKRSKDGQNAQDRKDQNLLLLRSLRDYIRANGDKFSEGRGVLSLSVPVLSRLFSSLPSLQGEEESLRLLDQKEIPLVDLAFIEDFLNQIPCLKLTSTSVVPSAPIRLRPFVNLLHLELVGVAIPYITPPSVAILRSQLVSLLCVRCKGNLRDLFDDAFTMETVATAGAAPSPDIVNKPEKWVQLRDFGFCRTHIKSLCPSLRTSTPALRSLDLSHNRLKSSKTRKRTSAVNSPSFPRRQLGNRERTDFIRKDSLCSDTSPAETPSSSSSFMEEHGPWYGRDQGGVLDDCLPQVATLNLAYNSLTCCPGFTGGTAAYLQVLNLRNNSIEVLEGLELCLNLRHLDLRDNLLTSSLALEPIRSLGALAFLAVSGNPISHHPLYRSLVVKRLNRMAAVRKFALDSVELDPYEKELCIRTNLDVMSRETRERISQPPSGLPPSFSSASFGSFDENLSLSSSVATGASSKRKASSGRRRVREPEIVDQGHVQVVKAQIEIPPRDIPLASSGEASKETEEGPSSSEEQGDGAPPIFGSLTKEAAILREKYGPDNWMTSSASKALESYLGLSSLPTADSSSTKAEGEKEGEPTPEEEAEERHEEEDEAQFSFKANDKMASMSPLSLSLPEDHHEEEGEATIFDVRSCSPQPSPRALFVYPTTLLERDVTWEGAERRVGGVTCRWDTKAVSEVTLDNTGDESELKVTIRFQTLRRSAKERIYVLARADAEHLFSLLRPHMESNALAEVIRGAHQCVRCGSQFTLTSAQARAGAGVTCPHCGSDVVLKVDSCKEKVPASQPTTTTTRPTGSLSPGSSSGTSTPIARSTSQPPTEDSDGVEVVSETSSIEVVMDSNTLQKQSKLPEPLDEVAEEAVTTESSLSTPRVAETDRHQTSGPPASGANVMSESNSSGSMTASTTTQIDKEDRLTEEEKSPPPPPAVLSETPVREETGVAEEQSVSPRSPSLSSLKNRTSLSHPVTPAKRQQLASTAQNPKSESKSDTLRNISSLLERHARKTQEMEALSNSTDSDSSSSREYSLGLLLAQVGQLRGSALGQSPANRGVSIEDLQHVSLNSKIPAYSWEQPDGKLDHRLQLYCEVVLFRESSEFVLTVHRCEMWVSSAAGLQPSLLVISNKKVYFLRIHGMESESPSSWLTLVHSFHCTQLRCVSLTLCSQALLMTFAQTPSKPPLLLVTRDAVRTQTLVRLIHEKFPSLGAVVSSSDSSPVHCGRLSAITKAFLSDEDSASSADIVSTFICFVKASPRESWESCIMSLTSSHILLTTCDLDWIITEDGSNPEVKDFRPINSLVGLESYQPLPSCLGLHFIDADSTDVLETQWRVAFEKDFQSFLETLSPYWSAAFHQELKLTEGVL